MGDPTRCGECGSLACECINPITRRVLDHIVDTWKTGDLPTRREICDAMGWSSVNAVAVHIESLRAAGYITAGPRIALTSEGLRAGGVS